MESHLLSVIVNLEKNWWLSTKHERFSRPVGSVSAPSALSYVVELITEHYGAHLFTSQLLQMLLLYFFYYSPTFKTLLNFFFK